MKDPNPMTTAQSLPFTMNQVQINAAILQELPRLLPQLEIDYVNGRAPKGLTAQVTVGEAAIRAAVLAHARRLVNPVFTYFSVDFVATRGEDGITANVVASNVPLDAEEAAPEPTAPAAPVARRSSPVAAPEPVVTESETTESGVDQEVPFEQDEVVAESAPEAETVATKPVAPAGGRSRLFAGLSRPDNSASAE